MDEFFSKKNSIFRRMFMSHFSEVSRLQILVIMLQKELLKNQKPVKGVAETTEINHKIVRWELDLRDTGFF